MDYPIVPCCNCRRIVERKNKLPSVIKRMMLGSFSDYSDMMKFVRQQ